ncbi:VOC family protein [Agrobacterium larrymoorei]|uniref:VOC family protein n=1 Tax=Agrobacterium larrymoorei TaxID=160699 RepID=UPI001571F68A|nr:VOC family protein [Agrobacterium larrymoorei]NTJ41734.1 VOC family protein [Agrobacterium larrymoorei]
MIGYTMVGTRDLDRAVEFYDAVFAEMGLKQCFKDEQVAFWGDKSDANAPRFATGYPFNGDKANVGNGVMTAFLINSSDKIDRLYEIGMSNGGADEGAPGLRPDYGEGFYAAYIRDPDGNKIAFVCYDASKAS